MSHALKLIVTEIELPWISRLPFPGTLYAGTPSRNKPKQIDAVQWCADILNLAEKRGKAHLVIQESFWPKASGADDEIRSTLTSSHHLTCFDLPEGQTHGITPQKCVAQIVQNMKDAEDVLILCSTTKISGFIPAILSMLVEPDCHIEKVLWPIEHGAGYVLTPAQRGYLAGLYDAADLRSLGLKSSGNSQSGDQEIESEFVIADADLALLQKNILWTQDQLKLFGSELFHEISSELIEITNFLTECQEHPSVDVTLGGMASVSYRLCEVFKETASIGLDALTAAEDASAAFPSNQCQSRLADLRGSHGQIVERLGRLYDSTITFIPCDLDVLLGHPEISNDKHLHKTIKLIADQLDEVFTRLDEISAVTLNISHAVTPEPASFKKDRDWTAMQAMLAHCVQTCLEQAKKAPTPRWVDQPMHHPKLGDSGEIIAINHPTRPSGPDAWHSDGRCAVFVPGGKAPKAVNGVAIHAWRDHPRTAMDWNASELLLPGLNEPPPPKSSLPMASGVVIVEPDGRIWMVSPTNKFGGYETTFPKGKLDHSELSLQANALKEGYEESGLKVRITGYLGDFKRTTSITRLYLAQRVGGDPTDMGWESQAVRLVPKSEWAAHLQNPSDKPVLAALLKHFDQGK